VTPGSYAEEWAKKTEIAYQYLDSAD
jgi:hypothetical protein